MRLTFPSVPHSDYIGWGLDVSPLNIGAGEDIRYLPRHLTEDLKLPDKDYWLLDDDTLILSVFSPDGLRIEILDDWALRPVVPR